MVFGSSLFGLTAERGGTAANWVGSVVGSPGRGHTSTGLNSNRTDKGIGKATIYSSSFQLERYSVI